jgi:drug/metabolite transporter (DMT)-like permease
MKDLELTAEGQERKQIMKDGIPSRHQTRLRYDLLLIFVTMIWGGTFLVVKYTVRLSGPFTYLALVYGVGTLTLALIFQQRLRRITRTELLNGLVIGMFLFTGYALQTIGLQFTTVSKAGFITGLNVPLIPVFAFFFLRQRPAFTAIIGIVLSFLGLILISLNNQFSVSLGPGELLILGGAVAFAMHVISISRFAPRVDAINLAITQMALTSLLSFLVVPFAHETFIALPPVVWIIVLCMGIGDAALGVLAMNWVQQFISSTRASLIYALEPMWAAFFGYMLAGDRLSIVAWIGCACIFLGMIVGRARAS